MDSARNRLQSAQDQLEVSHNVRHTLKIYSRDIPTSTILLKQASTPFKHFTWTRSLARGRLWENESSKKYPTWYLESCAYQLQSESWQILQDRSLEEFAFSNFRTSARKKCHDGLTCHVTLQIKPNLVQACKMSQSNDFSLTKASMCYEYLHAQTSARKLFWPSFSWCSLIVKKIYIQLSFLLNSWQKDLQQCIAMFSCSEHRMTWKRPLK